MSGAYSLFFTGRAKRQIRKLDKTVRSRVIDECQALASNPRPPGCTKLTDRGGYRIRVGDYRVLFEVDDSMRQVIIQYVAHRRESYREN